MSKRGRMILSELMDKLGIPSQAKDIMAEDVLNADINICREDGKRGYFLTGEVSLIRMPSLTARPEIVLWVEA